MRRGRDLHLAYEVVSWYTRILQGVLQSQSEKYRQAAATLLVQCSSLKGSLFSALENGDPVPHYNEAMQYAYLTGSATDQAVVHRQIAVSFWDKEDYVQALSHAEQACNFAKNTDGIIQSYVQSMLMGCQAATGNTSEALITLDKAWKMFDTASLPITIQYSSSILAMCTGTAQFHAGNYEEAAALYTQSIEAPDTSVLGKVQASIKRATVEACRGDKPRDMGLAISHWEQGIIGAKELGSERFVHEARKAYPILVAAWPREDAIKKLRKDYFGLN
jgi:tetratricopeptide (TPR) repeat protein